MYLCSNKLTSKYGKKNILIFYIHYKARKMSESSFFHSFIAVFPFSFVSNKMNFFIYSLSRFAGFLQLSALFVSYIYKYTFQTLVNWTEKKTFLISM